LNGIRSGGTLTAEEAEQVFGDTFILWEPHNMHGSRIQIGTHITIKYVRPEDGFTLSDLHYYKNFGNDGVLIFRQGGNKSTYFVFSAENEAEAVQKLKETIWTTYQQSHWDSITEINRGKE